MRRVLTLKVWHDVVNDGLGTGPFDPAAIIEDFDADRLPAEDIGLLTQPVEPSRWLAAVRDRYPSSRRWTPPRLRSHGATLAIIGGCNS